MRKLKKIGIHYFDKESKKKYSVGDLVEFEISFFGVPFKNSIRLGIIVKVIENKDEVFRKVVLDIFSMDGTKFKGILPCFDRVEILSKRK